jgi:hypothetical protein
MESVPLLLSAVSGAVNKRSLPSVEAKGLTVPAVMPLRSAVKSPLVWVSVSLSISV